MKSVIQRAIWQHHFRHPVEKVWPLISNTDRFNRSIGLNPVSYRIEKNPFGGTIRFAEMKLPPFQLRWLENPYEWEQHRFFSVKRVYSSGPFKWANFNWKFENVTGGCIVHQSIEFEASKAIYRPILNIKVGRQTKGSYLAFYKQIDESLDQLSKLQVYAPITGDVVRWSEKTQSEYLRRLKDAEISSEFAQRIVLFLKDSQGPDLIRIRPYSLAKAWGTDRVETVSAFLKATRAGFFDLSWDLLCPSCRGSKARVPHLADFTAQAHCDQCDVTIDGAFDQSVELTFSVHPSIRATKYSEYCAGGPQNTEHRLVQLGIDPGQTQVVRLHLDDPGVYVLRSLQSSTRTRFEVSEFKPDDETVEPSEFSFSFGKESENHKVLPRGDCLFKIHNSLPHRIEFFLERAKWLEDICTAAAVTSLGVFRDLFANEVLKEGQQVFVASLTLLFTDLKDSTSLYQRIGDARAFALVQRHIQILTDCILKHQGTLVKTIGDAVMASFLVPENAIRAALDIQAAVVKEEADELLQVRIGINRGPCFAVNMNQRMDYFGSVVNIAARAEGQCRGGEIVFTSALMDLLEVKNVLDEAGVKPVVMVRQLKGFNMDFSLYCVSPHASSSVDAGLESLKQA